MSDRPHRSTRQSAVHARRMIQEFAQLEESPQSLSGEDSKAEKVSSLSFHSDELEQLLEECADDAGKKDPTIHPGKKTKKRRKRFKDGKKGEANPNKRYSRCGTLHDMDSLATCAPTSSLKKLTSSELYHLRCLERDVHSCRPMRLSGRMCENIDLSSSPNYSPIKAERLQFSPEVDYDPGLKDHHHDDFMDALGGVWSPMPSPDFKDIFPSVD